MVREEAVKIFKCLLYEGESPLTDEQCKDEGFVASVYDDAMKTAIKALQEPEIVHCRECKHSQGGGYPHCSLVTWWNGENDFCSRAERREDE